MSSLVTTFELRLAVSHEEARNRVIGLVAIACVAVASIAAWLVFFPWQVPTQTVELLPGHHKEVSQILDGEMLVERDQFLQLAAGKSTFVAPGERTISYLVKVDGISYRYDQKADFSTQFGLTKQTIQGNILMREFHRRGGSIAATSGILFLALVLCLRLAWKAQNKEHGTAVHPLPHSVWL